MKLKRLIHRTELDVVYYYVHLHCEFIFSIYLKYHILGGLFHRVNFNYIEHHKIKLWIEFYRSFYFKINNIKKKK